MSSELVIHPAVSSTHIAFICNPNMMTCCICDSIVCLSVCSCVSIAYHLIDQHAMPVFDLRTITKSILTSVLTQNSNDFCLLERFEDHDWTESCWYRTNMNDSCSVNCYQHQQPLFGTKVEARMINQSE